MILKAPSHDQPIEIIIQTALQQIADFVYQIRPLAFEIYLIEATTGKLSILKLSIKSLPGGEGGDTTNSSFIIVCDYTRTYDDGASLCNDFFDKFRQLPQIQSLVVKEDKEDKDDLPRPTSLLRPSNRYESPPLLLQKNDIAQCLLSNYWEDKRHGYASLISWLQQDKDNDDPDDHTFMDAIVKDLCRDDEDDELSIMAIIALRHLMEKEKNKKNNNNKTPLSLPLLLEIKLNVLLERPIPKIPFHHGSLSPLQAQELVGAGMPGRFLIYNNDDGNNTKIITYHAYINSTKIFHHYDITFAGDGQVYYNKTAYQDIWQLIKTLPLDLPIATKHLLLPVIKNEIQKVASA
jgi:hypothetical protein